MKSLRYLKQLNFCVFYSAFRDLHVYDANKVMIKAQKSQ